MCVCVSGRLDLLLQQAVSKETGVGCSDPGGGPMLQEAGPRLGEAFVLPNTPLEPVEPSANIIPNMPGKERKQKNSSNVTVIQDKILQILFLPDPRVQVYLFL